MRARLAEAGIDARQAADWRCFVNSRLPEKRLALEAGLGGSAVTFPRAGRRDRSARWFSASSSCPCRSPARVACGLPEPHQCRPEAGPAR